MVIAPILRAVACLIVASSISGCASLVGYPEDPLGSDADLATLRNYGGPEQVALYFQLGPRPERQSLRDSIVYARLAAYDIEFYRFQADLNKEANLVNVTGDFAALTLNGLGATTGGVAAKAALAAAAAGVTGARAAVAKDVFFNQAIPALLAQMSASRLAVRTEIEKGLTLPDAVYPLPAALLDTNKYHEAGSLPSALNLLSANANVAKARIEDQRQKLLLSRGAGRNFRGLAEAMSADANHTLYLNIP